MAALVAHGRGPEHRPGRSLVRGTSRYDRSRQMVATKPPTPRERWLLNVLSAALFTFGGGAVVLLETFGSSSTIGINGAPTIAFGWIGLVVGVPWLAIALLRRRPP